MLILTKDRRAPLAGRLLAFSTVCLLAAFPAGATAGCAGCDEYTLDIPDKPSKPEPAPAPEAEDPADPAPAPVSEAPATTTAPATAPDPAKRGRKRSSKATRPEPQRRIYPRRASVRSPREVPAIEIGPASTAGAGLSLLGSPPGIAVLLVICAFVVAGHRRRRESPTAA